VCPCRDDHVRRALLQRSPGRCRPCCSSGGRRAGNELRCPDLCRSGPRRDRFGGRGRSRLLCSPGTGRRPSDDLRCPILRRWDHRPARCRLQRPRVRPSARRNGRHGRRARRRLPARLAPERQVGRHGHPLVHLFLPLELLLLPPGPPRRPVPEVRADGKGREGPPGHPADADVRRPQTIKGGRSRRFPRPRGSFVQGTRRILSGTGAGLRSYSLMFCFEVKRL
ncbi:hypothetical protein DFJ74DRAFT_747538, partial [Hyaloraphidium curvatum]